MNSHVSFWVVEGDSEYVFFGLKRVNFGEVERVVSHEPRDARTEVLCAQVEVHAARSEEGGGDGAVGTEVGCFLGVFGICFFGGFSGFFLGLKGFFWGVFGA